MNRKNIHLCILFLVVILLGCSSVNETPVKNPSLTINPISSSTVMVTEKPIQMSTVTLSPTSMPTSVPAWVTNFSEPILASIKDREPDFQDNFSINTERWYGGYGENDRITIENGVMRLQGDISVSNYYFLYKPNIILQVDIIEPLTTYIIVILTTQSSVNNTIGNFQLESDHEWLVWDDHYKIRDRGLYSLSGEKSQITIIIKGSQVAYYLDGMPLAYYENQKLIDDKYHSRRFTCGVDGSICYFDNVKIWNLDEIPDQP